MVRPRKNADSEEKEEGFAIDDLVKTLKKEMSDSPFLFEDLSPKETKFWLSTGSTILDMKISNDPNVDGGIPSGRLCEIAGDYATGKSLLGYKILKNCQDKDGIAILIDTERALTPKFLKLLGLSDEKEKLIVIRPESMEEVFKVIESTVLFLKERYKDKPCAILWDSIAATATNDELERGYDEKNMAPQARVISQSLRKIMATIADTNTVLIFINQIRTKLNVQNFYADNTVTPGGKAIPFYSSVRIKLLHTEKLKNANGDEVGAGIKARVEKNKMGPPHGECKINFYFAKGVVDEESWLDAMKERSIVNKENAQVSSYTDKQTGEIFEWKNREFIVFLNEHPELKEQFKQEIKQSLFVEQDPSKIVGDILIEADETVENEEE